MKRIRSNRQQRKPGIRSGSFCIIESQVPEPGRDFPRDEAELERMFDSEDKARRYLESMRFPRGFVCGHCGEKGKPWRCRTGLLACVSCRKPCRATEGTLFDGSVSPMAKWLRLLWRTAKDDAGLSIDSVKDVLGVTCDDDAADVVERVRHMMGSCSQAMLSGDVELAVSRINIADASPLIAIAVGREGPGKPRARLRALTRVTARPIQRFVIDHIEEGSRLHTNSWRGFNGLAAAGYDHRATKGNVLSESLNKMMGLLELWLWSQPDVEIDDLQPCLDDFAFRYNRRLYPTGLLFYRLMILAVTVEQRQLRRLSEVG